MAQESSSSNEQPKGYPVRIFVYDLSQGMASSYSQQLIGKQVDGIWHTSIIVYEKEYFYGGGIQSDNPGQTPYGTPLRRIDMGETYKTQKEFHDYLSKIAPRFSPSKYDLFKHNCNTFADEAMKFLNDKPIPEYITGLPEEFLNSAVGQMLKPMIDNMQQTAMANYGDYGGMGLAAKPNLPPLNSKYNKKIINKNVNKNDNNNSNINNNNNNNNEQKDNLIGLLGNYYGKHKHQSMDLKIIKNELGVKITNDGSNCELYVSMIKRNKDMINAMQEQGLMEIVKFINNNNKNKKLNDDTFEILDELLLMYDEKYLFPVVSLLKLLLVNDNICNRYNNDFMIINQILYKINIPFEELNEKYEQKEEKNNNDMDIDIDSGDNDMNLMDMNLLQFTAICTVSNLYKGYGNFINIDDGFINLGINGLYINNSNVGLACSRLLFNIVYEIKRQIIFNNNNKKNDNNQLVKQLKKIIGSVYKYFEMNKNNKNMHIPTVYRLLCIFGLVCYCNDNGKFVNDELSINKNKINDIVSVIGNENKDIQSLQKDIIAVCS